MIRISQGLTLKSCFLIHRAFVHPNKRRKRKYFRIDESFDPFFAEPSDELNITKCTQYSTLPKDVDAEKIRAFDSRAFEPLSLAEAEENRTENLLDGK